MKYIEELKFGDAFEYLNEKFLLTQDFDSRNNHRCVDLSNGQSRWLLSNSIVKTIELYTLDNENNISPIKPRDKETI
jgi:hypothetical protein